MSEEHDEIMAEVTGDAHYNQVFPNASSPAMPEPLSAEREAWNEYCGPSFSIMLTPEAVQSRLDAIEHAFMAGYRAAATRAQAELERVREEKRTLMSEYNARVGEVTRLEAELAQARERERALMALKTEATMVFREPRNHAAGCPKSFPKNSMRRMNPCECRMTALGTMLDKVSDALEAQAALAGGKEGA